MVITDCNKCPSRNSCNIVKTGEWDKCTMVQHHWDERGFELFKVVLPAIIQTEKGMPLSEQVNLAQEATSIAIDQLKKNPKW